MEYEIGRGMEILRLSPNQIDNLQNTERAKGRCFLPHEIQEMFRLSSLKVSYVIPEVDATQSSHAQKLRNEYFEKGLYPAFRNLGLLETTLVHQFDDAVIKAGIDFVFSGGSKKRFSDSLDN